MGLRGCMAWSFECGSGNRRRVRGVHDPGDVGRGKLPFGLADIQLRPCFLALIAVEDSERDAHAGANRIVVERIVE